MRRFELVVIATLLLGCHPTTDVHGIYVGDDGEGTLFPCDDPTIIVRVPDSALAATYRLMVTELHQPVFVHLRGVSGHAGSIYGGPRYFLVHQVVEIRARQTGECPKVTHPVSPVFPSSSTGQPNKRLKLAGVERPKGIGVLNRQPSSAHVPRRLRRRGGARSLSAIR